MAIINLYNRTYRGSVIMTGNSTGISTASGTQIGAFSIGLPTNIPPSGTTTSTASLGSSSAKITIPTTATVRAAYLLWSASSSNPGNSIGNGNQNTNISLRSPDGTVNNVTPAISNRQLNGTISTSTFSAYSNATDITNILISGGSGFYTVGGVLGVLGGNGEHNGWIIIVAYEDPTEAFRNLNIWTALDLVAGGASPSNVDIPISGFSTPSSGPTQGKMIISAGNGNAELSGESTAFGPNALSLATLSGPNNQANNFFASQINNNAGLLDKTGTFGTHNSTPGATTPSGSRNNWDITRVDATAGLTNNQMSGIIRFRTLQDTLFITGVALQVDVNSANLSPVVKTVDKSYAYPGDELEYTISTINVGLVTANNVIFIDTTPNGTTFKTSSVIVNNTPQAAANPNLPNGISIGNIGPNVATTIKFKVITSETIPSLINPIINQGYLGYNFVPATGLETIPATSTSNFATTTLVNPIITSNKIVNKSFATIGDILTYTIPIINSGNVTINNIFITDTIPSGTTYISGTFKQDGIVVSGTTNLISGTLPNSLKASSISTVTFQVMVATIPSPNPIINVANIEATFTIDLLTIPNRVGAINTNTNTVSTQVNNASLRGITKFVDKSFADCGSLITYTIVVPNSGNVTALNVVFKDTIPNGTVLVPNSVLVNGTVQSGANPATGVAIPNIGPGLTATLTFSVVVQC